jgi:hypothetical protein
MSADRLPALDERRIDRKQGLRAGFAAPVWPIELHPVMPDSHAVNPFYEYKIISLSSPEP